MTDEEMSVNWIRSQGWSEENLPSDEFRQMFEAYLAGLKAGRPEWHNLKKDPNDLPKESNEYLVHKIDGYGSKSRELIQYNSIKRFWCVDCQNEVIAWCEIPKYTEE